MIANTSIILYGAIVLLVINIIWLVRMEMRLKKVFRGKRAQDLEEIMSGLRKDIDTLHTLERDLDVRSKNMDARIRTSLRGIDTIRFNPFKDQGSNQSFAIGLLNEEGTGVVISSLYSRDRVSVFAKPIKKGQPEYDLTEEESIVFKNALPK
ncbi:MAG: DUF4446 family protein [Candidatus Pacebacteria bacterium]|nr:DUF4446 family protein [Candidatus Paceibacterota bacterium]MBP9781008.1 DUF4446 family protein [Candidatus Paceibacterota bacterium]